MEDTSWREKFLKKRRILIKNIMDAKNKPKTLDEYENDLEAKVTPQP